MEFYGQRFRRVAKLTCSVHLKRHMCNSSIAQPTHANSKAIHYLLKTQFTRLTVSFINEKNTKEAI
jgi:hypothetical protein